LAENDKAIVVSHKESDLRYKINKEMEFVEDKFSMTRYTDSLSRYLKFHSPSDKLVAHIKDTVDSLDNKLLLFPQDIDSTNFIQIQKGKDATQSFILDLRQPKVAREELTRIFPSTLKPTVNIWVTKPVTLLMRTHKHIKHHFSALNITPKGHLLFSSVDRKENS
jgi:hypothetical protein